jgi:methylmalonyl-CoA/ethylmalonyl-CoA epimerase
VFVATTPEGLLNALRAPGTARVHQIGIVVASCDEAVARYTALFGYPEWRRSTFGPEDVRRMTLRGADAAYSMRLAFAGTAPELELIEPAGGGSLYGEWLEERGEGLHHLAIVVSSLDEAIETMERAGFANIQSGHGFSPNGKGGYAYFDTVGALGFILEAVEMP